MSQQKKVSFKRKIINVTLIFLISGCNDITPSKKEIENCACISLDGFEHLSTHSKSTDVQDVLRIVKYKANDRSINTWFRRVALDYGDYMRNNFTDDSCGVWYVDKNKYIYSPSESTLYNKTSCRAVYDTTTKILEIRIIDI